MLRRSCIAVCLLVVTMFIGGCSLLQYVKPLATAKPPPAPHFTPPANSLVVLNFRWSGDADAKPYAIGFARALGDRLYCAPTCLTHQPTTVAVGEKLPAGKTGSLPLISDETASKAAKALGVRYALTGDFKLTGDQVEITSHLLDVIASSPKPRMLSNSGSLDDLPSLQISFANDVAEALKLDARFQPNFSNPKTLLLYGKSTCISDYKTIESLRWQAVEGDPDSSFPAIRLLSFYVYGPACGIDIIGDKKLNSFMEDAARRYPQDSHVNRLIAWMLVKEYHYRKAEALLRSIIKRDPNMAMALDSLACTAMDNWDADTAVQQGKALVALWPTSARAHAVLAQAYEAAANNSRHARFYNEMSSSAERTWRVNCERAFVEASTAVGLDPDNYYAWTTILDKSRELGYGDYVDRAFEQMIRINPKNRKAYIDYAYTFAPKWGGSVSKQEEILKKADQVFGRDSADALLIRQTVMGLSVNPGENKSSELLRLLDLVDKKSKQPHLGRMNTRCWILFGQKRHEEALEIAKKGFAIDPSPDWRLILAKCYQARYENKGDRQALDESAKLMAVYVAELPLARHGHTIYGWSLSHQGKTKEAREQFLTALKIDPEDEAARKRLQYVGGE